MPFIRHWKVCQVFCNPNSIRTNSHRPRGGDVHLRGVTVMDKLDMVIYSSGISEVIGKKIEKIMI